MKKELITSLTIISILLVSVPTFAQANEVAKRQTQELPNIQSHKDIEYALVGEHKLQLDLYLPEKKTEKPLPVIMWVHGGAWIGGSKDRCPAVRMAARGYAAASINYRLSPIAPFPAQIHDCKAAVRWLRANAAKYGLDPDRIGVWGASAGGHLVALLGTTAGNKELEGTVGGNLQYSSTVQVVCDWFGPTDFLTIYPPDKKEELNFTMSVIAKLLGGSINEKKDNAILASPASHVSSEDSPFLIMHGDKDPLVPLSQSQELYDKLKAAGVSAKLHVVKGAGHGFGGIEINKMVNEFFDKQLKAATPPKAKRAGTIKRTARAPNVPEGTRILRDLEYVPNGHERQKLDLYLPEQSDDSPALPLIVWIHGGAWRAGNKQNCRSARFLQHGYAAASINYRLSQHEIFPAQLEDCKAAIRFLRTNAKKYKIDPERIGVWGSSAGGHLVALLGTTGDVKGFDKGPNLHVSSSVQAVCDYFGPTDFTKMSAFESRMDHDAPDSPESILVGGPIQENKEACKRANPITYISKNDPPFLICHGDKDMLVPHNQSVLLNAALKKAGVDVKFHTVKGGGHGFRDPEVERMVREFFDKHLKGAEREPSK
ncbi:MAG: alpha/beta hydrolase fold domain-containing protein [Planctomycetota bacterium]